MHNDPQNAAGLALPFPDALQEFRVATSGLTADNGVRSGASVNAVTRSGTNRYSGNGFEFYRDAKFNAISRFAPIGPDGKKMDDGLTRHCTEFKRSFPGIVLDVMFENRVEDLMREEVDIAVRVMAEPPQNLVARDMGPVRYVACASSASIDGCQRPARSSSCSMRRQRSRAGISRSKTSCSAKRPRGV